MQTGINTKDTITAVKGETGTQQVTGTGLPQNKRGLDMVAHAAALVSAIAGRTFYTSHQFLAVVNAASGILRITTPASPDVIMRGSISLTSGPCRLRIREAPTITGVGTPLTAAFDKNRKLASVAGTLVAHTPTYTGGVLLPVGVSEDGGDEERLYFGGPGSIGLLLKVSTEYIIDVLNDSGINVDMLMGLDWSEE